MMSEEVTKPRSFWARPEGKTGMVAIGLGGLGLFFAAPALLAFVSTMVSLVGQTIVLVALCSLLAAFLFLVTNKKVRTLVSYMFKSAMRQFTGWFVEIDPIGIMKSYVDDLKKKRETMSSSRDKLKGQITVLQQKIRTNEKEHENAMALAHQAHKNSKQQAFTVNSRQAGRLEKLNRETYGPLLTQMQIHLRALDKYYEVTGTVIDDLRNEVRARQDEREMVLASHSAMSAAKQILNGGTDQKELFDQAMEYVVQDFGMKMGEIDNFIESSKGFVEGLDLQNGVYEEAALKRLEEWSSKADSILLGSNEKAKIVEQSTMATGIGVPAAVHVVDYSQLLSTNQR